MKKYNVAAQRDQEQKNWINFFDSLFRTSWRDDEAFFNLLGFAAFSITFDHQHGY